MRHAAWILPCLLLAACGDEVEEEILEEAPAPPAAGDGARPDAPAGPAGR